MRIGFIGAGKVGCSLGRYLADCGNTISGYYSKNPDSAREAAVFTGSGFYRDQGELIAGSDMIFLTVPDDSIAVVWDQIQNEQLADRIVCHCSGVLSSEIFSNSREREVLAYSVHPLLAVNDRWRSYEEFTHALFTIEGERAIDSAPAEILRSCGNPVVVLRPEDKVRYHAAAVLGSNLVLGLAECAIEELLRCGFSEEEAQMAFAPFMKANIAHLGERNLEQCLTGPVERGDVHTVEKHMETLEGVNREIYRLLSQKALGIAQRKNPAREYGMLRQTLADQL